MGDPWRPPRGPDHVLGLQKDAKYQGEFTVLVTRDEQVFTFLLVPGSREDIRRALKETVIVRWEERSTPDERYPYEGAISAALELLHGEERIQ